MPWIFLEDAENKADLKIIGMRVFSHGTSPICASAPAPASVPAPAPDFPPSSHPAPDLAPAPVPALQNGCWPTVTAVNWFPDIAPIDSQYLQIFLNTQTKLTATRKKLLNVI